MSHLNCEYSYIIKGDWYERFVELLEMFQISLHKKFVIWTQEQTNKEYNLIVVHGISSPEEYRDNGNIAETCEKIFNPNYHYKINYSDICCN